MSLTRLILANVFVSTFVAHVLYVGACSASVTSGWADFGISAHAVGPLGLAAYWRGQDYFIGFSYALAAAFVTWALSLSVLFRQGRIVTAGVAAGGMTFLGALMASGCFLIDYCGFPMLEDNEPLGEIAYDGQPSVANALALDSRGWRESIW